MQIGACDVNELVEVTPDQKTYFDEDLLNYTAYLRGSVFIVRDHDLMDPHEHLRSIKCFRCVTAFAIFSVLMLL